MPEKMNVRRVAELAKLSLTPEEESRLAHDMEGILAMAQELQRVDVTDVPPTQHILPIQNVFRADEPHPCLLRETLLSAAPAREDVYIAVPRTME